MTMSGAPSKCAAYRLSTPMPSGRWSSLSPFFSYAVHDAVARAGRAGLLIDLVRRWEEFLVDGHDTFDECWGWGTPVHGWSSTPTRDLILVRAGITPAEPAIATAGGGRRRTNAARGMSRSHNRL
jgi:hypothetical protein